MASIIKKLNKQTGVTYVYESESYWDKEKKQPRSRRKLIGKIDEKTGMTNKELMEKGRSPIDSKTGEKIELHHMGQDYDSPFAELDENSEHGDGNHKVLHPKTDNSWRNDKDLKNRYQTDRKKHWKQRSTEA